MTWDETPFFYRLFAGFLNQIIHKYRICEN